MKAEDILEKLISFNTVRDKENGLINDYLAGFLQALGFSVEFKKNKDGRVCLWAAIGEKPKLTFLGHTDVVEAGSGWTLDPFKLTAKGGKLYGLGASDTKGGIAALLAAISRIDLKCLKNGLNLLFSYDEEIESAGVKDFINKNHLDTKYLIVIEPTDLVPTIATKGKIKFRIEFLGRGAHGSDPEKGKNAILMANDFLSRFQEFFEASMKKAVNDIFDPPTATFNIARIVGGNAFNKVPESCILEFECRTVDKGQGENIYRGILEMMAEDDARVEINFPIPPMICQSKNLISFLEEITGKKSGSANYTTEGSFFADNEIVVLGPGPVTAHLNNEYITEKSLTETSDVYEKIIKRYCF